MRWAVEERRMERDLIEFMVDEVDEAWSDWKIGPPGEGVEIARAADWLDSVERFIELQLDTAEMIRLIGRTMRNKKVIPSEKWTYFCGCCWRAITDLQDRAKSALNFDAKAGD